MRRDLQIIADLTPQGARVLDLGCGTGELLAHLVRHKHVQGYGLDNDPGHINACVRKGVNVIDYDLDEGLDAFQSDSFDMVVMTETLQTIRRPDLLLDEMLRISRECIVTFPNFAHWRCRLLLATGGRMPVTKHMPYQWFDTPNIHLFTFRDFENLCRERSLHIAERFVVDQNYETGPAINLWPNLFGMVAFYRLARS